VDATTVRATVLPYAQRGFFAVRARRHPNRGVQLPWIEQAEVRKHWPDVLWCGQSSIVRSRALGLEDRLLSEHGKHCSRRRASQVPKGLPQLDGPESPQRRSLVALYNESRERCSPMAADVRALRIDQARQLVDHVVERHRSRARAQRSPNSGSRTLRTTVAAAGAAPGAAPGCARISATPMVSH
jgi:hypothetical protein